MKKNCTTLTRAVIVVGLLTVAIQLSAQVSMLPKGNWSKGTPDRFSGDVWVEYLFSDSATDFLSSRVLFAPDACSNWHVHKGKQIIFAIEGTGLYREKGKPAQILKKGDVVIISPGTIHSHGAYHNSYFMQSVTMNTISGKDATVWMEKLTKAER